MVSMFKPFIPAEVRLFGVSELSAAKSWFGIGGERARDDACLTVCGFSDQFAEPILTRDIHEAEII